MTESLAEDDDSEPQALRQGLKNLSLIVRAELYDFHFTGYRSLITIQVYG
jgi:hypothetical protein